jgi:uncharacterized protein DUF3618
MDQEPSEVREDVGTAPATDTDGDAQARTPEEIRADIEQTREELGETVEALAEKTDVKAQARAKVDEAKSTAKAKAEEVRGSAETNPVPLAAGAAAALVVGFLLIRRARR